MASRMYLVDAFAEAAFGGNPAGVVPCSGPQEDARMQSIATELNQAETAFYWHEDDAYRLKWFTPVSEVSLCGHATLAAAHILYQTGEQAHEATITFRTLSGDLLASREGRNIRLDFPAEPPTESRDPEPIRAALDVDVVDAFHNGRYLFAVLRDEAAVRNLPVFGQRIAQLDPLAVCITAPAVEGSEVDFVSRFFAPLVGIMEDPVTGSAHCATGPYWAEKLGKPELRARQLSPRGGDLLVRVEGDRVALVGHAVTTLEGMLKC